MNASLCVLVVVSLLVACTHGQLCPGEVYPLPPDESCGLENISKVELFNSPGPENRHLIDIVPCDTTYQFRLTMTCPALNSTIQVCDDEHDTPLCTPCDAIFCGWAHFFDGWVNEVQCMAFNRTGTQRVLVTFPLLAPEGETQTLNYYVPVQCTGEPQIPPPIAPQPPPIPCDSSTVSFITEPPAFLQCGGGLAVFNLSSTSGCNLGSGGILVCDSQQRNCEQMSPTETLHPQGPVIFNVYSTPVIDRLTGPLIVTATYQIGPFIGTIATTLNKETCPCTQR